MDKRGGGDGKRPILSRDCVSQHDPDARRPLPLTLQQSTRFGIPLTFTGMPCFYGPLPKLVAGLVSNETRERLWGRNDDKLPTWAQLWENGYYCEIIGERLGIATGNPQPPQ